MFFGLYGLKYRPYTIRKKMMRQTYKRDELQWYETSQTSTWIAREIDVNLEVSIIEGEFGPYLGSKNSLTGAQVMKTRRCSKSNDMMLIS